MRFSSSFVKIALFIAPALAAPALKSVVKFDGEVKAGSYLVTLKSDVSRKSHVDSLKLSPDSEITHEWDHALNGFAGIFTEEDLNTIRASPDVELIEEDGIVHASTTQTTAPWGLGRISSKTKLADQVDTHLTFTYNYDASAGTGVDVYVIDTGIYTAHSAFGGRASWGTTFGGYASQDGNGHGTHCAGTAVSSLYGVSKSAHVIAVKVLSDAGSGYNSDVISGINWVASTAPGTGRPSVASMSLGGGASSTVDSAITSLSSAGVPVAVAAGNDGVDAINTSPARAAAAITVGASTIADAKASWSNYGSVVDIWAPGLDITSTWIGSTTAKNTISGTSMATPHVAGLVAYLLGIDSSLSVAQVISTLKSYGLSGVLTGIPSGTVNLLINNQYS